MVFLRILTLCLVLLVPAPLLRWRDVEGSKLRPRHFVIVMGDFVRIYSRYLRRVDMR